ncbi:hypothetical protein EPJ74_03405 [Brachyspira aalborgi]|uniref:Uncharacterized protein n=1 Tax=Brachyspira aalborgi TaxID=29522 RepID=A0A5C8GHL3_9SPIR|nr:hypothetical protein [Brachyspira aalborgi]TXJ61294.1 hypothetical protein EPJ74_03405 [Brachyspira aalborgi]
MISKNKNLFLKIYILFVIIISVALIILQILGYKKRIGYLTDFNLNIERTLELNNLNDIREEFTIDGKLDEEDIKNYLLTNENITNYIYQFRIRYYDKVFRNSDIYGVYPDLSNLPDYMENAEMEENGSPYGNFISGRKTIEEDKIDNVNYKLSIKPNFIIILVSIMLAILCLNTIIYFIINNINKILKIIKNIISSSDKKFIIITIFIGLILFIFQFWLGFPGWFQNPDLYWESMNPNKLGNWHPVLIQLTLICLYKIFGIHLYYLFLINLILFYSGLILIIISLYHKFKNKNLIFLYLLIFVKEIFFMNISEIKDSTAALFIWLLYSLIFFQLLVKINNKHIKLLLKIFTAIILLFGLLWRHNMIVTIYPIFILFVYQYLKNKEIKSIKNYIKSFIILMLLSAIILVGIVKVFPYIWIKDYKKELTTNSIFLIQIAACSIPENDDSLIPLDWYEEGKTFENVKELYNINPFYSDPFGMPWRDERPFKFKKLDGLEKVWIKYILKYPINYIKHISINLIAYINKSGSYPISDVNQIQEVYNNNTELINKLNENEQKITFTPLRYNIYDFLFNNTIHIPVIYPVIISFIIFIITFIFIFIKKIFYSDILIYSFSISLSSIATLWILGLFSPVVMFRYIYPFYPISIISLISFITFIYDNRGLKNKRGENK